MRRPRTAWLVWLSLTCACSDNSGSDPDHNGSAGNSVATDGGTAGGSGGSANAGRSGSGASAGSSGRGATGTAGSTVLEAHCGASVQAQRCFADGWCWELPAPFAGTLYGIDGASDGSSIFAVGALGSAFRSCNGEWSAIDTGTEADLLDVWHPNPDLGVAVGSRGVVLRWDGSAWSPLE